MLRRHPALAITLLSLLALPLFAGMGRTGDGKPVTLGLVDSMVDDLSPGQKTFIDSEFVKMVKEFTSLDSRVIQGGKITTIPDKLAKKEWTFAVMSGVEFAWAKAQDPRLEPLMTAIYKEPIIKSALVAMKDSDAKSFADFKGKPVNYLPKLHCTLFADKHADGAASKFFSTFEANSNVEKVLDDILLKKVQASVVDNAGISIYKAINPGRWARLKIVVESVPFPAYVVAYRKGEVSDTVLNDFKMGMLKANDSTKGQEVMANFKITRFEPVPDDFAAQISTILKAYPAPKK